MAGPLPVVGIAAKFADAFRWSTHQAYVLIHIVAVHQVLPAFKNRHDDRSFKLVLTYIGFDELCRNLIDFANALHPFQTTSRIQNFLTHIIDAAQKTHLEPLGRNFFTFVHGPKAIAQVVVLYT